jgi:hypothetical protein
MNRRRLWHAIASDNNPDRIMAKPIILRIWAYAVSKAVPLGARYRRGPFA